MAALSSPIISVIPSSPASLFNSDSDLQPVAFEILQRCIKFDNYANCNIDLSNLSEREISILSNQIAAVLPKLQEQAEGEIRKTQGKKLHMLTVRLTAKQSKIFEPLLALKFSFHSATPASQLLIRCHTEHNHKGCNYPVYRSAAVGATAVVFNRALTHVLAVIETEGPTQGRPKPVTGIVDYGGDGEDAFDAAIRELAEETGIKIDKEVARREARMTSFSWSNKFRGDAPDLNFAFAFTVDESVALKKQPEEIKSIRWMPVEEYLKGLKEESASPTGKPWIMRKATAAALNALKMNQGWSLSDAFYISGSKPLRFFAPKDIEKTIERPHAISKVNKNKTLALSVIFGGSMLALGVLLARCRISARA